MVELVTGRHVLVIGHADGDGYLAAEQSRRNVLRAGAASCEVLVDPRVTPGYRFWERWLARLDFTGIEVAIFVDLMLNYREPTESIELIRQQADKNPNLQFLVVDHHKYEVVIPAEPQNLQFRFTDKVYECCFGEPSDLMIVASICDRDEGPVSDMINDAHRRRASGVSRAAADRRGLAGTALITLLKEDRWDILEALGQEDRQFHRTVRGIRPASTPVSPALHAARLAVV